MLDLMKIFIPAPKNQFTTDKNGKRRKRYGCNALTAGEYTKGKGARTHAHIFPFLLYRCEVSSWFRLVIMYPNSNRITDLCYLKTEILC